MKEKYLEIIDHSRKYTLDVADRMPEQDYSFRPVNTVWDFRELLQHIAYGIHWWEQNYILQNKIAWEPPVPTGGKTETRLALTRAYENLEKTIRKSGENKEISLGFFATVDHITHHRGQAVLYLRCKGIEPPEYVF